MLDRLIDEELLVQRGAGARPGASRPPRARRPHRDGHRRRGRRRRASASRATREVAAFYAANRDFFAGPGRLRVRQVFVRVSAPTDPAALARAEAGGAPAARRRERSPRVAAELGDPPLAPLPDAALPPAKLRDYLGPTALRAALELGVGAVSDPVRSGTGYHVLQVVERQPDARAGAGRDPAAGHRRAAPPRRRAGAARRISTSCAGARDVVSAR